MEIHGSCPECGKEFLAVPKVGAWISCSGCKYEFQPHIDQNHEAGEVKGCAICDSKYVYKQKDFNRKIGILLFIIASILALFTYGISLIVLYVFDYILNLYIGTIVVCYKCGTVYRNVKNLKDIEGFDHETHDRTVYT